MVERAIFITGATGLVGTEVVAHLLATTNSKLYVLVRAGSTAEAEGRLHALWGDDKVLDEAVGRRVVPIVGDITRPLDMPMPTLTHVIHCAADTGLQRAREELWRVNVEGTRNVVDMAKRLHGLERFTYVSTAYVAGTLHGRIMEDSTAEAFYSLYEQSKAEAEAVVRASALPFTICRPGMIVGNSRTGRTRNFNTIYYVLKLMLQGKLRLLPVNRHQRVNVVPVDYVARTVADLTMDVAARGRTFHLTAPYEMLPQVGELVEEVRRWSGNNLRVSVPRPLCISMPWLRTIGRRYNAGKKAKSRSVMSNLTALMPYFLDDHVFDRTNTDALTGSYDMAWRDFVPRLLAFACRQNFMRLSDKSIFEQAVERRQSKHYPITYFDITADGMKRVTGPAMNAMVVSYVAQLQQLGVKAGDRVAVAGINCTEHAAIDSAIGLTGAVSVPIYYTTPPDELALLLERSGARWFFIGDERIGQSAASLPDSIRVIPFGPLGKKDDGKEDSPLSVRRPSSLNTGAMATIRYTSGTTGEPKGVMFSFRQLKWMGQVLTNLLPWRERNSEMRYLSFLPMSHVVEGILAAYAPYCMLCKAKVYYLNDFQMLAQALPKVRPTVFFSVPRFYEKLWEQLEQSAMGQRYMKMNDGWPKRLVAALLRRVLLRRAGLDRCAQLLVGSAPISEELLLQFSTLGIEIHNAYGQTEAPLITLNRMGNNVIPSVGTPLPDTTVGVDDDGELTVSGPQVAMGYYGLASDTFQGGVLHTGDIGNIGPDGSVYISGRKKDMLITSYGKNINCTKVEQRLMDIACVEQAVLVGEGRPYCTALLWVSGNADTLAADIERMNSLLSHPEQVKRWRIVEKPLSIKDGELTPNLKVKRAMVLKHYEKMVNELYT